MDAVIVVGDDSMSQEVKRALVRHNITVLGAGLALGMPLDSLTAMCVPLERESVKPRELTAADTWRIEAAEAKRQRRAAKRLAILGDKA